MPELPTESRMIDSQILTQAKYDLKRRARSSLHILVVDDDLVTQQLLKNLLATQYSVVFCSNVGEAIQEYLRVIPDLVFLDINLGDAEFNGFDVGYTIFMHDHHANIIYLTAHESAENIARATRSGASGFIAKPFEAWKILNYVSECENLKETKGRPTWS